MPAQRGTAATTEPKGYLVVGGWVDKKSFVVLKLGDTGPGVIMRDVGRDGKHKAHNFVS